MSQLDELAQHRDAILLAEVGAWLHMLGKYNWQFIEKHCGGRSTYDYQNFMPSLNPQQYPELSMLLDPISTRYETNFSTLPITAPTNAGVFICKHRQTQVARQDRLSDQLTMLLVDAHGRGSNIEKSEIKVDFLKQTIPEVYLSTAFGFDYVLDSANYKTSLLYQELEKLIMQSHLPDISWDNLIYKLRQQLYSHFSSVLAETRLPFSDVTLFDQTASSVAFFKAALVERVIAGSWKPLMSGSDTQYKWRTLTIPFAKFSYFQNISGISDLLARRSYLIRAQNGVQKLLEISYPVGQEIYRDELTSVFLVPDDVSLLQWQTKDGKTLQKLIQQVITEVTQGDLYPDLENSLVSQGSRTVYTIGQQINDLSKIDISPDIEQIVRVWNDTKDREVCTNCAIRPQGVSRKASRRNVCDLCLERRESRSKKWIREQLSRDTIWLDEVADTNGRLALLVGNWSLERWLDSTLVSTIIAAFDVNFTNIEQDCKKSLRKTKKGNPQQFQGLLTDLISNDVRQQFNNQFRGYYNAIIQPEWQYFELGGVEEETIATIHFVRQNPSFARLRRVWQTTQKFWQTVLDEPNNNGKLLISRIPYRLKIIPKNGSDLDLGHYHAYVLKLTSQIKLSVVWDPQSELFITCDNLDYLAKPELLGNPVQDYLKGELDLEEPAGYGSQNKRWGTITIEKVEPLRDSHYVPAIPILAEPRTFMALVPADKALDILQAIKTKYEREMGKVRNRLPLHMGVVYFQRRTPLRTALDAGRRMLEQQPLGGDEPWTVVADVTPAPLPNDKQRLAQGTQQFNETLSVSLSQGSRSFTWYVPAKMGDGSTEDKWYPYVFFASDKEGQSDPRHCSKPRDLVFKGLRPTNDDQTEVCWLIHASQLKPGDRIYFTPATFDFEWLNTTARRFAIAYDKQGQRIGRLTRPYLLDQLDDMESAWQTLQKLSKNQLYALRDTIEEKRQAWFATPQDSLGDPTFEQFCADVVRNTKWQENVDVKQLGIWAVNGLLTDVIELHASIMKEDSQMEEQSNG